MTITTVISNLSAESFVLSAFFNNFAASKPNFMVYKYDFLIIGAGVAGMSYALKVARAGRKVCIICKTSLDEANT